MSQQFVVQFLVEIEDDFSVPEHDTATKVIGSVVELALVASNVSPVGSTVREIVSTEDTDRFPRWAAEQRVAALIQSEVETNFARWGEQNYPDGTSPEWGAAADRAREATNANARLGRVSWLDVLKEEVYESFAETDPEVLVAELKQVGAVTNQWIAAIQRREPRLS